MPRKSDYELDIIFGERIKTLRLNLKLTHHEVSSYTGISKDRLIDLETSVSSRSVTEREILSLAQIYSTNIQKLRRIVLKGTTY